jgi:acyl dehydratase
MTTPLPGFDPAALFAHEIPTARQRYAARDTILYALSLGAGADPLAPEALRHCLEDRLQALPTQALVLATPGFWLRDAPAGVDWRRVLHGEQRLTLHRPLPAEGEVVGRSRIAALVDRGPTGAILHVERRLEDADGTLLATAAQSAVLRGHGGFGRDLGTPPPPLAPVPETQPARRITLPTRPEAALIYRLNGDWNPLHADPEVASAAGFDRPILHGLASFGVAARGLIAALCPDAPARLRGIAARFAAPVFPGDALIVEIWDAPLDGVPFRVVVEGRGVMLSHGSVRIGPEAG